MYFVVRVVMYAVNMCKSLKIIVTKSYDIHQNTRPLLSMI